MPSCKYYYRPQSFNRYFEEIYYKGHQTTIEIRYVKIPTTAPAIRTKTKTRVIPFLRSAFSPRGSYDLVIDEASSFCGCTVPTWTKEKIAPGDNGEIDVHFHKSGELGKQDRMIVIKANTEPKYTTISIKANIIALNTN